MGLLGEYVGSRIGECGLHLGRLGGLGVLIRLAGI